MGNNTLLPHVLIDGASVLTADLMNRIMEENLYGKMGQQLPEIWKTRPLCFIRKLADRGLECLANSFYHHTFNVGSLINGDLEPAKALVQQARNKYNLYDDEALRIAFVGSHYRTVTQLKALNEGPHGIDEVYLRPYMAKRKLLNFIRIELKKIGGVEAVWLNTLHTGELLEPSQLLPEDSRDLKSLVRGNINQPNGGVIPNSTQIYSRLTVNDTANPNHWERWSPSDGGNAYSTSHGILEQFEKDSLTPKVKRTYALVKLLGDDLGMHNPFDTPIFDIDQLHKASAAGIKYVLLDPRVGIVWGQGGGQYTKETLTSAQFLI